MMPIIQLGSAEILAVVAAFFKTLFVDGQPAGQGLRHRCCMDSHSWLSQLLVQEPPGDGLIENCTQKQGHKS